MIAALLLAAGESCGGQRIAASGYQPPYAGAPGGPALPLPLALRGASELIESSSYKYGDEFRQDWPRFFAYSSEVGDALIMSNGGMDPVTRYCFAGYSLHVPPGEFDNTLRLEKTEDWEENAFWVGLADFVANCWDWQAAENYTAAIDPARHLLDGEAFVFLSYTGQGVQEIESIRLGALAPPFIRNVSPPIGAAGAAVTFSARLLESELFYDQPYYASGWHWEFNGAATPASSDLAEPAVTLSSPGEYSCSLATSNPAGTVEQDFIVIIRSPGVYAPATLYAVPAKTTAAVGEQITVRVITGELSPYEPLSSLSGVGVSVPSGTSYVPGSFNVGIFGGGAYDTDGFWNAMNPAVSDFIHVPDGWFAAIPTDTPGELLLPFSIAPILGNDTSASGVLFNFKVSFSSPGLYEIGFVDVFQGERTHFTEDSGMKNYWYDISNDYPGFAHSVAVNP